MSMFKRKKKEATFSDRVAAELEGLEAEWKKTLAASSIVSQPQVTPVPDEEIALEIMGSNMTVRKNVLVTVSLGKGWDITVNGGVFDIQTPNGGFYQTAEADVRRLVAGIQVALNHLDAERKEEVSGD